MFSVVITARGIMNECFALPGELYKWEAWSFFLWHRCSLSLGAFPFGSVDTAGLQLGTEGPSWVKGSCLSQQRVAVSPNKHKSFAWVFQPDVVWLYAGRELTSSYSTETIGKLKNIAVSEITAKYILWGGWEGTLYFSKVGGFFCCTRRGMVVNYWSLPFCACNLSTAALARRGEHADTRLDQSPDVRKQVVKEQPKRWKRDEGVLFFF